MTSPKVLIVADQDLWSKRAASYLALVLKCQVVVATSVEAAWDSECLPEYDVVFVDHHLVHPENALRFALRAKALRPTGPVYLATEDFMVERRVPGVLIRGLKLIDRAPASFEGELRGHIALHCFYHVRDINRLLKHKKAS